MHLRRQLGQKTREMRLHRRRQLVHVIDHEHEAATITAEVRENPIHHRAGVEARRGGKRARQAYRVPSGVNNLLIINKAIAPGRITAILVNEQLGF
jgi:hypothetical protein